MDSTQAYALLGNWTGDFSVHRPALNPLSHASQGFLKNLKKKLISGRERERKISICCFTYLCIHWLLLVCTLARDWTHNLDIGGWSSNQLNYWAMARDMYYLFSWGWWLECCNQDLQSVWCLIQSWHLRNIYFAKLFQDLYRNFICLLICACPNLVKLNLILIQAVWFIFMFFLRFSVFKLEGF